MIDLERALSSLQQLMLPTGFMHVRWQVMLAVNVVMQPGSTKAIIVITVTIIIIIIIIIIITIIIIIIVIIIVVLPQLTRRSRLQDVYNSVSLFPLPPALMNR